VASVWIRTRATKSGNRYHVEFRPGGREERVRFGGAFTSKRLARIRAAWIEGELAAKRLPDLRLTSRESEPVPTFVKAAATWRASRVDIAASTRDQHRIQLDKLLPLIGTRPIDELTAADFIDVAAALHEQGVARETIRKTLGAGAMVLDHAGINPNPARDRSIKLPREEPEQINPPSAADVETVFARIPADHRLALLWLDWSGARVSSVDHVLVGDYDEPRRRASACARRRPRRVGRCGSSCTRSWPRRSRRCFRTVAFAIPRCDCSGRPEPTRCGRQLRRPARRRGSRCSHRTTSATGGSRCCICAAFPGPGSPNSLASASCR
jgi:hypothetical protein